MQATAGSEDFVIMYQKASEEFLMDKGHTQICPPPTHTHAYTPLFKKEKNSQNTVFSSETFESKCSSAV